MSRPLKWTVSGSLALVCVFATAELAGSEIKVNCARTKEPMPECPIVLRGKIVEGDADKLRKVLIQAPKRSDAYRYLVLDSRGGDMLEAFKLAEIVRGTLLETRNFLDLHDLQNTSYPCVSACAIVLMTGTRRTFSSLGSGKLGLHRPFFDPRFYSSADQRTITSAQHAAMKKTREFLVDEGVSQRLVDEMMNRSSQDIYWVSWQDWSAEIRTEAAWYEELFIARCKPDLGAFRRYMDASMRGGKGVEDEAKKRYFQDEACRSRLTGEMQARFRVSGGK